LLCLELGRLLAAEPTTDGRLYVTVRPCKKCALGKKIEGVGAAQMF